MAKVGEGVKRININWITIAWGLIPVVILAIVFAVPLKTVAIQTTETYLDTEIVEEPYTVTESYQDTEEYVTTETRTETIFDSTIYSSKTQTFQVDNPGSTVTVSVQGWSPYSYYPQTYVIYDNDGDPIYGFLPYSYYSYGGSVKLDIELSYPEDVTRERTVTKYRDVTKYREVPTQVEKERTSTEYVRMSIWKYLFMSQR